jgi:dissimilatory sulfite reductase (desulfoviridin) alpha/beta subunit
LTEKKDLDITVADFETLKSGGFIPQRQKDLVTVRCMAPGGRLTSERLHKIAEVAQKYGKGLLHFSVRMSPEILYVNFKDVPKVQQELAEAGQKIASCGRRVRVPTACGGCEYNPNGLIETQQLAVDFNDKYFGRNLHHKFKPGFSGCPIDCMRARESDLGFQGQVKPKLEEELCTGCALCVKACDDSALEIDDQGLPKRIAEKCIACGDCIKACVFDAMLPGKVGAAVYAGGKHGKHPHVAYPLADCVPVEKLFSAAEIIMDWYQENGAPGERIGLTIDRAGINGLRRQLKQLLGDDLLQPKDLAEPRWQRVFWNGVAEKFPDYEQI